MAKKRKSTRKTYRLKRTAKSAARGKELYKVKSGWRISRGRRVRGKRGRKRKRKRKNNPGGWLCLE